MAVSKAAIAFSEGRGASLADLLRLSDELCIPHSDLQQLRFDDETCREVERLTRIRAVHLLAYALGPLGEMAKKDPAAFRALAMVAGVKNGTFVQVNTVLDARLPEPQGAKGFIDNFRSAQKSGALRLLGEAATDSRTP